MSLSQPYLLWQIFFMSEKEVYHMKLTEVNPRRRHYSWFWSLMNRSAPKFSTIRILSGPGPEFLTCLQWQCGCLHPSVQTVLLFISWNLRHKFWHLCHTQLKYVLGSVLNKMACGLTQRETECNLQHMAVTWVIPCELRGIIMFFLTIWWILTPSLCLLHRVPSEQIILLCNEAVQSSFPQSL